MTCPALAKRGCKSPLSLAGLGLGLVSEAPGGGEVASLSQGPGCPGGTGWQGGTTEMFRPLALVGAAWRLGLSGYNSEGKYARHRAEVLRSV